MVFSYTCRIFDDVINQRLRCANFGLVYGVIQKFAGKFNVVTGFKSQGQITGPRPARDRVKDTLRFFAIYSSILCYVYINIYVLRSKSYGPAQNVTYIDIQISS